MKDNKKEIPCVFYFYLHSKLYDGFLTKEVKLKNLRKYLSKWNIPRKLRPLIIKELELLGLIKQKGRHSVEFETPKFSEEECNKFYQILNIF